MLLMRYFTEGVLKVGYVRISTQDQNDDFQIDALKNAGCEKMFSDQISGSKVNRPGLEEALGYICLGDSLVVWRLDRLGRNLRHLIDVVEDLESRKVGFVSLQEGFDTTTNGGKLVFQFFGALVKFERNLIREKTKAGLEAARASSK